MATYRIYVPNIMRLDLKMTPWWLKITFVILLKAFHAMLRHAMPHGWRCIKYCHGQSVNTMHLSIYRVGENQLTNDALVVNNMHFWSFKVFFMLRYAMPPDRKCAKYCWDQNNYSLHLCTKFGGNWLKNGQKLHLWTFFCFLCLAMPHHMTVGAPNMPS
jgi:hypothetical protein